MAIDPVCGMQVNEQAAPEIYEYQGETYYFCGPGCKLAFEETPEKFLGQKGDDHAMVMAENRQHGAYAGHGNHGGHDGYGHRGGCCRH